MGRQGFWVKTLYMVLACLVFGEAYASHPLAVDELTCVQRLQLEKVDEIFTSGLREEIRKIREATDFAERREIYLHRVLRQAPGLRNYRVIDTMRMAEHFVNPAFYQYSVYEIAIFAYFDYLSITLDRIEREVGDLLKDKVRRLRDLDMRTWQNRVFKLADDFEHDPFIDSLRFSAKQREALAEKVLDPRLVDIDLNQIVTEFVASQPPPPPLFLFAEELPSHAIHEWELARRGYYSDERFDYLLRLVSSNPYIQSLRMSRQDRRRLVQALMSREYSAKSVSQVLAEIDFD